MAKAIPLEQLPVFSKKNLPDPSYEFLNGSAFLISKPKQWSSFDVVKHLRKCLDIRKIGHAGTLDPMATGLLILCTGKGTKSISQIQSQPKEYVGEITFGASTPSHDAETDIEERAEYEHITRSMIEKALENRFSGQIIQVPPMYSALKHNGTPLYKLARKGKEVKRTPRQVIIYETEILDFKNPKLDLYVKCSKGTYIRTLAYDLGQAVDSLAHLTALRRTAIGEFKNEDALSIDELDDIFLRQ
ncbi:MAG: tRNA pseudouridine(55) synthase TruB [Balneolaceae bacterium]|nr:tRNA pseudouridine(55) synthase TruB [Balneolaceae bacterium]